MPGSYPHTDRPNPQLVARLEGVKRPRDPPAAVKALMRAFVDFALEAGEWATAHGEPFELVLEGPAGGKLCQGVGGERVELDAIDFVRILSGRRPGTRILSLELPL